MASISGAHCVAGVLLRLLGEGNTLLALAAFVHGYYLDETFIPRLGVYGAP